jgi:hypothetical protein
MLWMSSIQRDTRGVTASMQAHRERFDGRHISHRVACGKEEHDPYHKRKPSISFSVKRSNVETSAARGCNNRPRIRGSC